MRTARRHTGQGPVLRGGYVIGDGCWRVRGRTRPGQVRCRSLLTDSLGRPCLPVCGSVGGLRAASWSAAKIGLALSAGSLESSSRARRPQRRPLPGDGDGPIHIAVRVPTPGSRYRWVLGSCGPYPCGDQALARPKRPRGDNNPGGHRHGSLTSSMNGLPVGIASAGGRQKRERTHPHSA